MAARVAMAAAGVVLFVGVAKVVSFWLPIPLERLLYAEKNPIAPNTAVAFISLDWRFCSSTCG